MRTSLQMNLYQKRTAIIAVITSVILVGVIWAVIASRDAGSSSSKTSEHAAHGMEGMSGMSGMSMSSDGSIQLSGEQIRQFGITLGTAEIRSVDRPIRAAGVVTADERRIVQVAPKFSGFAEKLYVNFTGQRVQRGQPLLEIYSPELVSAQQELLAARDLQRTVEESAVPGVPARSVDLLAAARRRLELWDITKTQIDAILSSGRVRRTLTLYTPASGVVTEKSVVQGQSFMAGEKLYTIADLSRVWVEAELRETDLGTMRVGSSVTIEFTALPGRRVTGRVEYVYPTVDNTARAIRARISVPNPQGYLKPGMYSTVRLLAPEWSALTVPSSAVVRTGERNIVFVDMGKGRIMPTDVELGRSAGEYTEILAGIEPGQRVITSAQFLLDSESNLAEVMKSMMAQMSTGDVR